MEFPENLFFTRDHEWVSAKSGQVLMGVSAYAIEQLGDIVHVELPEEGKNFSMGDAIGTIESTKTVSDLYTPASGRVVETNKKIENDPESIQGDPYDKGWLVKMNLDQEAKDLMTAKEYENFIRES